MIAAAVVVAAAVLAVVFRPRDLNQVAFDQFWAPVVSDKSPILVAIAHPIVYHPSARATRKDSEQSPPGSLPTQHVLRLPAKEIDGSDMIPVVDQYVGVGDLVACSELTAFFARQQKTSRLRLASKVEFADLKDAPTILIGAYTNRWTIQLSPTFRYRFGFTPDGRASVQDATDPKRQWALPNTGEDGSSQEDYIVITRLANSNSGKPIVIVAGLKQFGTEAGGRLLANPEHLGDLLRKLPADWPGRNLQLLLHARVIGNSPTPPNLVASHLW